jgi:hypothetical protein
MHRGRGSAGVNERGNRKGELKEKREEKQQEKAKRRKAEFLLAVLVLCE